MTIGDLGGSNVITGSSEVKQEGGGISVRVMSCDKVRTVFAALKMEEGATSQRIQGMQL